MEHNPGNFEWDSAREKSSLGGGAGKRRSWDREADVEGGQPGAGAAHPRFSDASARTAVNTWPGA